MDLKIRRMGSCVLDSRDFCEHGSDPPGVIKMC